MSEVPLYASLTTLGVQALIYQGQRDTACVRSFKYVRGYLAHKKMHPSGPYSWPMPRVLGGPTGSDVLL